MIDWLSIETRPLGRVAGSRKTNWRNGKGILIMKADLFSNAVRVVELKGRLDALVDAVFYRDEKIGNPEEIPVIATELYDHANELRYQARQQGLQGVEHIALRAMDYADTFLSM